MAFSASRRRLVMAAALMTPLAAVPGLAGARTLVTCTRELSFRHLHTGEKLTVTYCDNGRYLPDALAEVNHLFRDFRSGVVHPIDPSLLDILADLREMTGGRRFEIISAYRSPATNDMLRKASRGGGVATRSLHMDGKAIDVKLEGVPLAGLRKAALSLQAGGVGYYPTDGFVHVDTGRVRSW
jgi:uncharacterized protein YcbK (DUF882 family)